MKPAHADRTGPDVTLRPSWMTEADLREAAELRLLMGASADCSTGRDGYLADVAEMFGFRGPERVSQMLEWRFEASLASCHEYANWSRRVIAAGGGAVSPEKARIQLQMLAWGHVVKFGGR